MREETVVETERLALRRYVPGDLGRLEAILSEPVTMKTWPEPLSPDRVRAWLDRSLESYAANGYGRYAIIFKSDEELIGDCGILKATVAGEDIFDLGYIIHHPYWSRGYATEAALAVRDHAFECLKLPALHANMADDNEGSVRVAENVGMTRVKEFYNERNRNKRTFLYALRNG